MLTAIVSFCMNFAYMGVILASAELVTITGSLTNETCATDYLFCVENCQLSRSDYVALIVASCGDVLGTRTLHFTTRRQARSVRSCTAHCSNTAALPLVLLLCELFGRRFAMASTLVLFAVIAGFLAFLQPVESMCAASSRLSSPTRSRTFAVAITAPLHLIFQSH